MLILDTENRPVDRVNTFVGAHVEKKRMAAMVHLGGRLVAYSPQTQQSYYRWSLVLIYKPSQYFSVWQFSPASLRMIIFSRWECGLVLGNWTTGLRLRQPLLWLRKLQMA
jgi:hypothetical protein